MKWLVILGLPFLGILTAFYFALILPSYIAKFICLSSMPLLLYSAMLYGKRKNYIILRMFSIKYKLGIVDLWHNRSHVIRKLQLEKLRIFLSNHQNIDAHKINFIIERLESENGYPRYQYHFKQIFSVFFSTIAGGVLTAIIALPEMFKTWLSVVVFFKPIIGVVLMITLFSWFFEEMLFKDVFNSSTRKYYRLIQTLENYYLEKY